MKIRKEVHIDDTSVILYLQVAADKKKWSLKRYMETILENEAAKIRKRENFKPEKKEGS